MTKFAKLFDVDNTQVLYQIIGDNEGNGTLQTTTDIDGLQISQVESFTGWDIALTKLSLKTQVDAASFYVLARDAQKK